MPEDRTYRLPNHTRPMTHQELVESLEANVGFAKDATAELLRYVGQLPAGTEQAHIVHEVQRIQGYLGGVILQMVRALRDEP